MKCFTFELIELDESVLYFESYVFTSLYNIQRHAFPNHPDLFSYWIHPRMTKSSKNDLEKLISSSLTSVEVLVR